MSTKIKGICKPLKYISQIFVVKEREMEIGYPTDVKHVAHIGWDDQSTNGPTWMNEFKSSSDYSGMSLGGSIGEETDPSFAPISPWSSQDFDQSMAQQPSSEMFNDTAPKDLPKAPKKQKRKKTKSKSTSSPKSTTSSKSTKAPKSKSSFAATVAEAETAPNNHQGFIL